MMERLTERVWDYVRIKGCKTLYGKEERQGAPACSAIARLAMYEDAMTLERVQELARAEKDGRLVVLPCKVGDTLYRVIGAKDGQGHIMDATISGLHMRDTIPYSPNKKAKEYIVLKVDGNFCAHIDVKQIGKTTFLTREEAEAALKKREASLCETY